jgi:PAS domain S-box-containing protein
MVDQDKSSAHLTRELQGLSDCLAVLEGSPSGSRGRPAAGAGVRISPSRLPIPAEMVARWQQVVDATARLVRAPAGLITRFAGSELEVFVASATEENPYRQGGRVPLNSGVYCASVIARRSMLAIPDARKASEWRQAPEINMGMCFYLGLPLAWSDGEIFGTVCLLDREENPEAASQENLLYGLRAMVEGDLRLLAEEWERSRLEGELKRLEEKFRAYYEGNPIPTFTWQKRGEDLVLVECNRAASTLTRNDVERYLGRSAAEIYQGRGDVHRDLWRCFSAKRVIRRQIRSQHFMPGRDLLITYVPVPPDMVVVHTEDITEHKQAVAALEESEARYRAIFENAVEGMFQSTPEGRYLSVNPSFARTYGFGTPEEMIREVTAIGRELYVDREERAGVERRLDDPGFVVGHEVRCRRRDGEEIWVSINARSVRDEAGRILYYEGSTVEITARKRAEEEIRTLTAELEERVARRTAQLEAANRELDAFAYSVSHDLRAPLRAMSGFSHLLLEYYSDKLDDQGRHFLQRMDQVSQRMGKLIDDLLSLSRLARREMQRERINLSEMARGIAAELRERDPKRRVHFVIAERLMAHGDPPLLGVVLENLLGNAWKFTAKKPEATIEFAAIRQKGKRVYFVRDDGIGFDMTYAEKIFQAFQRLNPTNEFEGSGIGLATVERIIHQPAATAAVLPGVLGCSFDRFRTSSPGDVLMKYASGPSPCGFPVARPSPRSRYGVSCIMRARKVLK